MTDIQKLRQKMEEAVQAPHLVDRLDRLISLQARVDAELTRHRVKKRNDGQGGESIRAYLIGVGITVATAAVAGIAAGPVWAAPVVWFGLVGSFITGLTYPNLDSTLAKRVKKYEKKHEKEIQALKNFSHELTQSRATEIERFRNLSAEERAGAAKLDELADDYPEIRRMLIQDFRQNVSPVFEQGGVQTSQQPPAQAQNVEVNEPEAGPV